MPFLRHAPRHIHASLINWVTEGLTSLGWVIEATQTVDGGTASSTTYPVTVDGGTSSTTSTDTTGGAVTATAPFGGTALMIRTIQPFVGDRLDNTIAAGQVCITLGDEANPNMEEMGGALASQEYPFFLDVFMATEAEALALATDIRDLLLGRVAGYGRFVQLVNQVDGSAVPGWSLELTDIERIRPQHSFPVHWNAVHATVTAQFNEVVW